MTCDWCKIAEENFDRAQELSSDLGPFHPIVERHLRRARGAQMFAARKHGPVTLAGCPEKDEK